MKNKKIKNFLMRTPGTYSLLLCLGEVDEFARAEGFLLPYEHCRLMFNCNFNREGHPAIKT